MGRGTARYEIHVLTDIRNNHSQYTLKRKEENVGYYITNGRYNNLKTIINKAKAIMKNGFVELPYLSSDRVKVIGVAVSDCYADEPFIDLAYEDNI